MKKLTLLLFVLTSTIVLSQTPEHIVKSNYTVTGNTTLTATKSIVLKPNTYIKAGSTFRAYINQDAYNQVSLSNENYVYTRVFQSATKTGVVSQNKDVLESVTYYDGLGRPKQSVGIRQSPSKKDIVTHIEYDALGRQAEEFLPYVSSNDNGRINSNSRIATQNYYKTNYANDFPGITDVNQINSFSKKEFDGSPLNRVMKQAAPGKDWKLGSGHEIKFDYQTNTNREVREYYVTTLVSGKVYIPTLQLNTASSNNNGYYNAGELYKTITKDENHTGTNKTHTTEEYKNKQGQVVLKRTYITNTQTADTYYVYDDFGNLTYVLSPKSEPHSAKPNATKLAELCYQYKYDYRNRLVEKKIPGKGWEYIVYDKLDRPVLTQDANQRINNQRKWLFTKYDALSRAVYTGIYTHSSTLNQAQIQSYFDSQNNTATKMYEKKLTSSGVQGSYYSNNNFPKSSIEVLTVNYYDDYTFNRAGASTSVSNVYGKNSTNRLKGLLTGSRVKVLGQNKWITTVTYYDDKARPIYVYTKNDYLNSIDILKSNLDFSGKIIETTAIHNKTDDALPTITTIDKFEYDHVGRVTQQTQKVNNQARQVIAENSYDGLGQLIKKAVGGKTNQNRLQQVDYNYNVRGWLTKINQDAKNDNDLFNFTLAYNKPNSEVPLFNGNISQTSWNTLSQDRSVKTYSYSYDALNRITSAIDNTGRYNVGNITPISYDKNGNILKMQRKRVVNADDNFTYHYDSGNKLVRLSGSQSGSFTYDANGNMKTDTRRGVTNTTYNHLNLPVRIDFGSNRLEYTYDATGNRLRKRKVENGNTTTTEYANGYIYQNNALSSFSHPEGYVTRENNGTFKYVYQLKDHLGSTRISYADLNNNGSIEPTSEILQELNYYPGGLVQKGYNTAIVGAENTHKTYQGQELEKELGKNTYAYKWRDYDPLIWRMPKIDRFAEKYYSQSPYGFSKNNPIKFVEIAGDSITPFGDIQYSKFNIDRSRGIDAGNKYQLYGFTGTTGGKEVQGFVASYQRKSGYRDDYIVDTESVGEFLETSKTQATIANLKEWAGNTNGSLWSRIGATYTPMNVMTGLTIGMGSFSSLANTMKAESNAVRIGMSDLQLVTRSAQKAESAIGGTGRFAGTAKHSYANNLLRRYQRIYGDRGFQFNSYFNNGVGNRGFLDVVNHNSGNIYDFKFGNATWRSGQFQKYQRNFPGYSIQIIRP